MFKIYPPYKILKFIETSNARFYALVLAISAAFLLGGGSRADIQSLLVLRPLSFLFLGYAAIVFMRSDKACISAPFGFILCLIALILCQLIPLPTAIWTSLPHREPFSEIAEITRIGHQWRPLTLSPSRTLNSLLSLVLPLSIILLYMVQQKTFQEKVLYLPIIIGGVSALLGLFQILADDNSPLYTYSVTNNGSLVGLFANRNHNAIFLASLLPMIAGLFVTSSRNQSVERWKNFSLLAFVTFLIPIIIMTGSRSGLLFMVLAIIMSAIIFWKIILNKWKLSFGKDSNNKIFYTCLIFSSIFLLFFFIAYLILNSETLKRISNIELVDDSRALYFPYLVELAKMYFPFGSGFGSFEFVYKAIEPNALLSPKYLNQGHNDLFQIAIEGGVPAALLVIIFCYWVFGNGRKLVIRLIKLDNEASGSNRLYLGLASFAAMSLLLLGSVFDYPLRTPAIMSYLALLTCTVHSVAKNDPS